MSPWSRLPLKGSKEYNMLVTLTGLAVGLVWVAKDEYENPKWTGIPKASQMDISDLNDWNKQFGPTDASQWAISVVENKKILESLTAEQKRKLDDIKEETESYRPKKNTW